MELLTQVEINNRIFKEEITYLEHRMSNLNTARYLNNTHIESMFHEMKQEHEYTQEERQEERHMRRNRGMDMGM